MSNKTYIEQQDFRTTVDYQAHESDEPISVKSVPVGKIIIGLPEDIMIDEEFRFNRIHEVFPVEGVGVRDEFDYVIAEAIEISRSEGFSPNEDYEYEVIEAIRLEYDDSFSVSEEYDFELILSDRFVRKDELDIFEFFDFRIALDIEHSPTEDIDMSESFDYVIILGLRRSEEEDINMSETFDYRIALNISLPNQIEDVNTNEDFSFLVINPISRSQDEDINTDEIFEFFVVNPIFAGPAQDDLSVVEIFSTDIESSQNNITDPPQNIQMVADLNNCRFSISWDHPSAGQAYQYQLEYNRSDGSSTIYTYSGSTTFASIPASAGNGIYEIRMRSRAENGTTGSWTTSISESIFCGI